jgi:hypothetical protein
MEQYDRRNKTQANKDRKDKRITGKMKNDAHLFVSVARDSQRSIPSFYCHIPPAVFQPAI